MALRTLRLSRSLASRDLLGCRPSVSPPVWSSRERNAALTSPICIPSRNYQVPSWLWPFGGSEPAVVEPVAQEVIVEAVAEPLEVITGFAKDGAWIPVGPDTVDFSAVAQWSADSLTPSLHSLDLGSFYTPVGWSQQLFAFATELGLPVLAALFCTALVFRLPSIPVYFTAEKKKKEMLGMTDRTRQLKKDLEYYNSSNQLDKARNTQKEVFALQRKSFALMAPLLAQAPVSFVFYGVRRMSTADYAVLANGHFLWLPSLTLPDPYYILPLSSAAFMIMLIRSNSEAGLQGLNTSTNRGPIFGMIGLSSIFMSFLPAASVLVIIMNSTVTFGLSRIVRLAPVRSALNLPPIVRATEEQNSAAGAVVKEDKTMAQTLSKRVSEFSLKKFPAVADFMEAQQQKQNQRIYLDERKEEARHYTKQLKLARAGGMKVHSTKPEED